MNQIARNLIAILRNVSLFVMLLISCGYCFANSAFTIPDFNEFNRGINLGSEISRDVKYNGRPTDKLVVGVKPPLVNNWESHSTVTTSLFPITALVKRNVVFYMKSFGMVQAHSSLWVSIRYFDKNGVFIDSTGGDTFDVPNEWKEMMIPLFSTKQESVYAEVWFVKFEDADKTGQTIHPIYLSTIEIR